MAKTLDTQQTDAAQDEAKRQRKKQAKREAKLMLQIEEARKEVQKAEQKFSKAQANLEASRKRLRELEEGFAQIHNQHPEQPEPPVETTPVETTPVEQSYEHPEEIRVPDQGESYTDREAVEELHQSSLPPVEGRSDIPANGTDGNAATPSSEDGN